MKFRIASIIQFTPKDIDNINYIIDTAKHINNKEKLLQLFDQLVKQYFKPMINHLTIAYLNEIGWNPLPRSLLPEKLAYRVKKLI